MRVQEVRGLVLVNPATSYERSNLARFGPICAALQGPLLYPLYLLSLVGFAALVLTPTYQAGAFISNPKPISLSLSLSLTLSP